MKLKALATASILPLALLPGMAMATNGYFSHGYGVKSQGMAGVGIALPQDGLAAATNPAGIAFVGNRLDLGLVWFRPSRGAEISGNPDFTAFGGPPSLNGSYDGNDSQNFFIPELGYVTQFSPQFSGSIAIYGNGGMNTDYKNNPFAKWGASNPGGVDLAQLFVTPTLAWKVSDSHSLGASIVFAYQRFKMLGVEPFKGFSSDPSNFTNNGYDSSTGWGARLGYTGKITPTVTLGATWASKTYMGEFDKYKGLFAEQGAFDIPSNYGVGVAWQATPSLTLAADVQRILYSGVAAIANPVQNLNPRAPFGSDGGPGFGWKDVTVTKLGAAYTTGDWTFRGGYNYTTQPIPNDQTFLNIYAPGVVQHHMTLGATWAVSKTGELSMSYMHAFKETIKGSNSMGLVGGGEADINMYEDSLGIAYGWKF
jgi:long-chain fatty acid transport protein